MKTIRTIKMMLALTVIANIALATGNLKVNILPLTSDRAVVAISNNAESQFEISIETENGEILYQNQTKGNSNEYNKIFDLSRLEAGEYKLIVNIDGEISQREFNVDRKKISVGKVKSIVKPFFTFKDNVLRVAYLNQGNEDMNFAVYKSGTLIYNKELENSFSINEGFNLSKLEEGEYQVVLTAGYDNYRYAVNIQ